MHVHGAYHCRRDFVQFNTLMYNMPVWVEDVRGKITGKAHPPLVFLQHLPQLQLQLVSLHRR